MAEFTGERVIPNLVEPDLLNEHLARYRFAARFAQGATVLDAGCGVGYGAAEFSNAALVIGGDISAGAIAHARENFARPGVRFVQAACEALPFRDAAFDLSVAFEVIEHLERWPELLTEARRVLKPSGLLLISTPNKSYYAEMRAKTGPNPFHVHEFEYKEFQSALNAVFPHVCIWAQNHAEAIAFAPLNPVAAVLQAGGEGHPEDAHFFLAACSQSPLPAQEVFAWLPSTANVLRERERHIAKLEGELIHKDQWLEDVKSRHSALQNSHLAALADLKSKAAWAEELNRAIRTRDERIVELQSELQSETARARTEIDRLNARQAELESDLAARTAWARSIEATLAERTEHVLIQAREIEDYIARLTEQARRLEELKILKDKLALISQSRWIQLGRKLNIGPVVNGE